MLKGEDYDLQALRWRGWERADDQIDGTRVSGWRRVIRPALFPARTPTLLRWVRKIIEVSGVGYQRLPLDGPTLTDLLNWLPRVI